MEAAGKEFLQGENSTNRAAWLRAEPLGGFCASQIWSFPGMGAAPRVGQSMEKVWDVTPFHAWHRFCAGTALFGASISPNFHARGSSWKPAGGKKLPWNMSSWIWEILDRF